MPNSYYNHATYPTPNSPGSSAQLRAELQLITAGFDKLPTLTGNGNKVVLVNSGGTALTTASTLANLTFTGATITGATITGGTINNTPIGGSTPNTGAFTSVSASGGFTGALSGNVTGNITSTGSSSFTNAVLTGGTINGVVIGATTAQAITGTLITATTGFSGPLTGAVTGSVTGDVTGNVTASSGLSTFNNLTVNGTLTAALTGNVTASSGTSTFSNVTINGTLNMDAGTTGTIENLSTPVNAGDAAPKSYVDTQRDTRLALVGGTMSGAIAMSTYKITGLGDPTAAQDAATKIYVDNAVQGLDAKASCRVATTANITLSGTQTIDGVAVNVADRVLVKDQSSAAENGIYVVAAGSWSRAADANTWDELVHAYSFVEEGTAGAANGYLCTVQAGGSLGSTSVTFVQFSGAGQITAGNGLTKTGNTLNVNTASASRIVVSADEIDLATTGVVASTYKSMTVDQWGRVTAGTNPTTLSGFGITDAYTTTQVDTALAGKLSLSGGTMAGGIAMGGYAITGLLDPVNAQDAVTKNYVTTLYGSTVSAANSAAAAAISESNAATSEANALQSENNAATSESNALSYKNSAEAAYDSFDDRYLGAKSSPPSVDNDGNPLIIGALYFDTTTDTMKVYGSGGWVAAGSAVNGTADRFKYTATASQTTFTGADDNANTLAYDAGYLDVYLNGVKQVNGSDFAATNGTSIVLATGAAANDILEVVAYGTFALANFSINDANDVNTAGVSTAQLLSWSGSSWVVNQTGAIRLPAGTTAQQPTPSVGMLRFNTTDSSFEGYNGTAWGAIGGGSSADGGFANSVYLASQNFDGGNA